MQGIWDRWAYPLRTSLRSMWRSPWLTGLMVLAVAMGIAAAMTMLTVLHNLAGNPLPQRSAVLFHPQVDPRPRDLPGALTAPPDNLTYLDAKALYALDGAPRRAIMSASWLPLRTTAAGNPLRMEDMRATTRGFFPMFDVPFQYGGAWSAQDDARRAQVMVLSHALNERLFGGADSVGRELIIATKLFRVVGVLQPWNPQPHFWDLDDGAYGKAARIYLPFFTWLQLPQDYGYGPMDCWGNNPNAGTHDPRAPHCTWVQMWVQLDNAVQVDAYHDLLLRYSRQQEKLGRFQRAPNVRLMSLMKWLNYKRVVPVTVRMQTWIAFGVFLVCLVNVTGLMVARFLRKANEIGVRRALGAARRDIFWQCLAEAGLIGVVGGLLALPLVALGLWLVRQQPVQFAAVAHLDGGMLVLTLLLATLATALAGIWPAWRTARQSPALVVKSL